MGAACRCQRRRKLLGPQQDAVAHLEHRVDPACNELCLHFKFRTRRREQLPCRSRHLLHLLRVVRRVLAGGEVVMSLVDANKGSVDSESRLPARSAA